MNADLFSRLKREFTNYISNCYAVFSECKWIQGLGNNPTQAIFSNYEKIELEKSVQEQLLEMKN